MPSTTTVAIDALYGSTLDLGGYNATIAGLTNGPNGGGTLINSGSLASTLTINQSGVSTFSGSIVDGPGSLFNGTSASLALDLTGSGTLYLSGSNNYSGGTLIEAGMLVASNGTGVLNGSALGLGALTLNGGTLAAGAAGGTISGLVQGGYGPHTIAPGGVLPAGQYGLLSLHGGLTTNDNTSLAFNLGAPVSGGTYSGDLIDMGSSSLTVQGGAITFGVNPTTLGDYRLFENLNLGISYNPTGFSLPTPSIVAWTGTGTASWNSNHWSSETYTLSTSAEAGYLDLVVASTTSTGPTSGSTVVFSGTPTAPITLTLDGTQSVAAVVFNTAGSNGYTLSPGTGGVLSTQQITVEAGKQRISAPISLPGNLDVAPAAGSTLQISGNISESVAGSSLSLDDAGTLILSGSNGYTGGTFVNDGTLDVQAAAALPQGSALSVGTGAASLFGSPNGGPMIGGGSVALSGGNLPAVPEPGTFALLAAGVGVIALGSVAAAEEIGWIVREGRRLSRAWERKSPAGVPRGSSIVHKLAQSGFYASQNRESGDHADVPDAHNM